MGAQVVLAVVGLLAGGIFLPALSWPAAGPRSTAGLPLPLYGSPPASPPAVPIADRVVLRVPVAMLLNPEALDWLDLERERLGERPVRRRFPWDRGTHPLVVIETVADGAALDELEAERERLGSGGVIRVRGE